MPDGERKKSDPKPYPTGQKPESDSYADRMERRRAGWSRETSTQRDMGGSEAHKTGFDPGDFEDDCKPEGRTSVPVEDMQAAGIDGKPLEEGVDPFEAIDRRLDGGSEEEDGVNPEVDGSKTEDLGSDDEAGSNEILHRQEEMDDYVPDQSGTTNATLAEHAGNKAEYAEHLGKMRRTHNATPRYKTDVVRMRTNREDGEPDFDKAM